MIGTLLKRELTLAVRQASGTGLSLAFMALFVLLCGLALDGARPEHGPGILWLAALLSALLGLDRLFQPDQQSGILAQLHLAGVTGFQLSVAKGVAFFVTGLLPLLIVAPALALLLSMDGEQITGTVLSLLIGAPAITAYATLTGALLSAQRGGGVLAVLLTAPLLIPVLLFGIEAAQAYPADGLAAVQFRILAGLSLIATALGLPATAAALAANRGPA